MRRHPKAATAGSTKRQATGLARFVRGAFAIHGVSLDVKGSGAPRRVSVSAATFGVVLVAMLATAALIVAPASASKTHAFKELFGSAAQPTFGAMGSVAIDQSSGDVLLMDSTIGAKVYRFNPDGTPDDFSALGTNAINGEGGADLTPQGNLVFDPRKAQIAVDNSGTATDGNIYVSQQSPPLVDVFSKTGAYLGQLTAAGATDFTEACGVAVDSSGAVYVGDYTGGIHKFVPAANPPVNGDHTATFTTTTEPCNLAAGVGSTAGFLFPVQYEGPLSKIDSGTGELKYTVSADSHRAVAVDPGNGHVYGATSTTINEFDTSGAGSATSVSSIAVDSDGVQTGSASSVHGVAVRSSTGDVYISRFGSGGIKIEVFAGGAQTFPESTTAAATTVAAGGATLNGTVNPDGQALTECVFEWGETTAYGNTVPCVPSAAGVGSGTSPVAVSANLSGLDVATTYHYRVKAVNANGALVKGVFGEDMSFQTLGPRIAATWAQGVIRTEAFLRAEIDPEEVATTYHFEYGTTEAYGQQTPELAVGSDSSTHLLSRLLEGLKPATTYHYKVVATSADGVNESSDHTLTTFGPIVFDTNCPNQAFRGGASATLPECRAYEMVSPIDKNGNDINQARLFVGWTARLMQSSTSGDKFTYSSAQAFGDAPASRYGNQYVASRGSEGWSSHGISPPAGRPFEGVLSTTQQLSLYYEAFTPDLSRAWLYDVNFTPLTSEGVPGTINSYWRDNTDDSLHWIDGGRLRFKGNSDDFNHILFEKDGVFSGPTPEFASGVYDYANDELHLVSVLPNGNSAAFEGQDATVGTGINQSIDRPENGSNTVRAVSTDGSRIFWAAGDGFPGGGYLYVRENPLESASALAHGAATGSGDVTDGSNEITGVTTSTGSFAVGQTLFGNQFPPGTTITGVGAGTLTLSANATVTDLGIPLSFYSQCTEPDKACTIPVSAAVTGEKAVFLSATADGSRVLFNFDAPGPAPGKVLYEFNVETETPRLIAHENMGILGATEDFSHIYFDSPEVLAPGATAGEHNLYLEREGALTFIAALADVDVFQTKGLAGDEETLTGEPAVSGYGVTDPSPVFRASRMTPDGRHIAFQSIRSLTGYDNTDERNGEPDVEVFHYDSQTEKLTCASCNPSGARPVGQPLQQPFAVPDSPMGGNDPAQRWTAAWLPTWERSLYASHALSDDGSRLFFNSFDALVPWDTNGAQDVYQWTEDGAGSCQKPDGCISLISSGESPQKAEFLDASPDGRDVFFETSASLLAQDPGLVDVYDARVGGGFPPPPSPPECVGDSCQGVPGAPSDPTPASASFRGAGNPQLQRTRRRCRVRTGGAKRSASRGTKSKQRKARRCKRAKRGGSR